MYFVLLDWVSDDTEWYEQRGQRIHAFDDCADALEFAHNVAYNRAASDAEGNPCNVTVFYNSEGIFDEEDNFVCSFMGCDKYNKCNKPIYLG